MLVRHRPFLFHPERPLPVARVAARLLRWTAQFDEAGPSCPRCGANEPRPCRADVAGRRRLLRCGECRASAPRERWYAPRRPDWI
ncbi:MAG: hypothetical protein RL653_972 [Pseudomonadota bacterium]|jgi:hypothetical protein